MSEYSTRNIIDFAYEDDGKAMRDALYANIHDRITAHLEDKKREIAQNLISKEEIEIEVPEIEDEYNEYDDELNEEQLDELSTHALNSYLHKGVSKFKQNAATMSPAEKQKKVAHLQKAHSKLKAKGGKFEEYEYAEYDDELNEEQLDELSKSALNTYLHKGVSKFKQNAATMSPAEKQKKVAHLQKAHSKLKAKGGKFEEYKLDEDQIDNQ